MPGNTRRAREKAARKRVRERKKQLVYIGLAAGLSVLLLIVLGNALRGGGGTESFAGVAQTHGRLLGSNTAPVVISVWEDFQCPVCKTANESVVERLVRDYVEPGVARLHFRHYAFLGKESVRAAEAAECAAEQHLFWPYHDELFSRQAGENRGSFSDASLKDIAAHVGLVQDSFEACFVSGKYAGVVKAERDEGTRLSVTGTPTFFVDGVKIEDWRVYESFQVAIERAAASRR
jgi:protein-disulfide isomerase